MTSIMYLAPILILGVFLGIATLLIAAGNDEDDYEDYNDEDDDKRR